MTKYILRSFSLETPTKHIEDLIDQSLSSLQNLGASNIHVHASSLKNPVLGELLCVVITYEDAASSSDVA